VPTLINFFARPHFGKLALLAVLVGIGGGIGSIIFHFAINIFTALFFGSHSGPDFLDVVVNLPWYYRLVIPAFGGLLVGFIVEKSALRELRGEGVPEVVEALAVARGKITPKVAPLKILTSAITLGSGGSAGREGPIIQIGSAIGSSIGQWLKLDTEKTRLLLAAGAAAGVAGTFNAPLAGIIFSAEILLKKVTGEMIILLAIAALSGSFLANHIFNLNGLAFALNSQASWNLTEIPAFLVLGVLATLIAMVFAFTLSYTHNIFSQMSFLPPMYRPALGGLIIGAMAVFLPFIHEPPAYGLMSSLLDNPTSLGLVFIIILLIAKIIATSVTLGSGGSGGILAPTLFIGVLLGSAYGTALKTYLPAFIGEPQTFAVLGMAAVLAAVAQAPLSAIVIVFEIAQAQALLIPLALVCAASYFTAKALKAKNIYAVED